MENVIDPVRWHDAVISVPDPASASHECIRVMSSECMIRIGKGRIVKIPANNDRVVAGVDMGQYLFCLRGAFDKGAFDPP